MLAEIFMLRLEALLRAPALSVSRSDRRFVPIASPLRSTSSSDQDVGRGSFEAR